MKTILRLALALLLASLGGLLAQSIEFRPAPELRYQSQPGRAFRLESSIDLTTWTPWSPTRLGDGQPVRELVPAGDSARAFRVIAVCNAASTTGTNPASTAANQVITKMIQEFLP